MNETVVAGRVKRAVIGLDLLVTKNEVCCRSFMALLSLFFFYSPQSHSWPWLNYYPRSCDIKMPACTHKMGCIEIKRLPYSPMAGSLERRHDLLVFLNSCITHTSLYPIPPVLKSELRQETECWVDVAGWIKLHHSRREISSRSSIPASTPLHEDAPGTLISLCCYLCSLCVQAM